MGLQLPYLKFMNAAMLQADLWPTPDGPRLRMCELGNQQVRDSAREYTGPYATGKAYYTAQGFDHVSIDMNGRSGALVRDLGKPLSHDDPLLPLGAFDVVTNSGTSEHVYDQYECFRNMHMLTRLDGLMLHVSPYAGWPSHDRTYTPTFFACLASAADYAQVGFEMITIGYSKRMVVAVAFVKRSLRFPDRGEFERLPS